MQICEYWKILQGSRSSRSRHRSSKGQNILDHIKTKQDLRQVCIVLIRSFCNFCCQVFTHLPMQLVKSIQEFENRIIYVDFKAGCSCDLDSFITRRKTRNNFSWRSWKTSNIRWSTESQNCKLTRSSSFTSHREKKNRDHLLDLTSSFLFYDVIRATSRLFFLFVDRGLRNYFISCPVIWDIGTIGTMCLDLWYLVYRYTCTMLSLLYSLYMFSLCFIKWNCKSLIIIYFK